MLTLEIPYENGSIALYNTFCKQLYNAIQRAIYNKADRRKYQVREPYILQMNFIKWKGKPLDEINLYYYITHCLVLKQTNKGYVIELNNYMRVKGSMTLVKDLIRLVEYGNEVLPEYPLIREILSYYQNHYMDEYGNIVIQGLMDGVL